MNDDGVPQKPAITELCREGRLQGVITSTFYILEFVGCPRCARRLPSR
jgi:hypothetical protein